MPTPHAVCYTGNVPSTGRYLEDTKVLIGGVRFLFVELLWADDLERNGRIDRLRSILDTQFAIDIAVMPFDGVQGQEQPLADLAVGETLRDQL